VGEKRETKMLKTTIRGLEKKEDVGLLIKR